MTRSAFQQNDYPMGAKFSLTQLQLKDDDTLVMSGGVTLL